MSFLSDNVGMSFTLEEYLNARFEETELSNNGRTCQFSHTNGVEEKILSKLLISYDTDLGEIQPTVRYWGYNDQLFVRFRDNKDDFCEFKVQNYPTCCAMMIVHDYRHSYDMSKKLIHDFMDWFIPVFSATSYSAFRNHRFFISGPEGDYEKFTSWFKKHPHEVNEFKNENTSKTIETIIAVCHPN